MLETAGYPKEFLASQREHSVGRAWEQGDLNNRFSNVWKDDYKFNQFSTATEIVKCNRFENMEACLSKHIGNTEFYRLTASRAPLYDFPKTAVDIRMSRTRVRLWRPNKGKVEVLGRWEYISISKGYPWTILTFWTDPHVLRCSSNEETIQQWIDDNGET